MLVQGNGLLKWPLSLTLTVRGSVHWDSVVSDDESLQVTCSQGSFDMTFTFLHKGGLEPLLLDAL